MKDEQKNAFAAIGAEVGVPDLADQITQAGQSAKEALDARQVERKSVAAPDEGTKEGTPQQVPPVVASLAEQAKSKEAEEPTPDAAPEAPNTDVVSQVVETLQLGELSKVLEDFKASIKALQADQAAIKSTLAAVTRSDEVKQAEAAQVLPRMSWMRASQAAETIIENKTVASVKQNVQPAQGLPGSVKALAQTMGGGAV